jgi:uncharacterized membrane protein
MAVDVREFVAEDLWLLLGVVTFALVSLAGLAGLEGIAGALAIVGWFLLVPLFLFWGEEIGELLFDESTEEPATGAGSAGNDALEELKRRYAAGEIDDAEFERRLDRLVEVEDALEHVFSDTPSSERSNSGNSVETEWER